MAHLKLYLVLLLFCKIVSSESQPVKLTMKQGLIMNQIISMYALDNIENSLCANHTNRFKNGLRSFEPWALKMFDSSSKLQSGILLGNLIEFGSFRQCVQIKFEDIRGKHCFIKITPSLQLIRKILQFRNISERRFPKVKIIVEKSAFYWSVCVPDSCTFKDVLQHFKKNFLQITEGLNLSVFLDAKHCLSEEDYPKLGTVQYIALAFLASFIIISLVCTAFHWKCNQNDFILIKSFSLLANFRKIVEKKKPNDLDFVHGLRFLSIAYVVIGHRYLMAMYYPVINGLEILDWILNYSSTIIIGGTICVDTFFFISGMLVSIGFFEHMKKTGNFNLLIFYIYRYLRLTPTLGVVVLIYATLIEVLGTGPLWYDTCKNHLEPCQKFWWTTLLHIQSYINPDSFCILQSWYLSCDMIYYYFSPLILYPLWKWKVFGIANYCLFYFVSIGVSFYLAWSHQYAGGMPITNQLLETEYFQKHYVTPHTRAAPYIIGLGVGYCLFQTQGRKYKMGSITTGLGWLATTILMGLSLVGCYVFQLETHDYNRLESSSFLAFSRSSWTAGLVWMVWACFNGHGGIVGAFLSCFLFRVLARISYGIFLLHMALQFFKNAALKTPFYFSNFTAIYDSFADLTLIIIASFFFTLFYELPLTTLQEILFKVRKKVAAN